MKKYFENDNNYKRFERVINSWIGTPYKHLTLVKGRGADCALFIGGVMRDCGIIKKVVYDYYPRNWHIHTKQEYVLNGINKHITEQAIDGITIERYAPDEEIEFYRGDILTFTMRDNAITNHAAYYIEGGFLIHSMQRVGVHKITIPSFFIQHLTNIFRLMEK